ncbi:hypothetical protein FGE12_11940 [Aggregicoccus sp. 17bor-14]|uniref:hypothetical protein n=1 Tax=Myxococcaceae TaxID=31 RepID=UPI00129D06CA|nr:MULTISPECIES: hypothetical protein [Myxococcaceae]MBF5043100.1 hypothetical protein [Simulacricoccus sp. 17bor-14]MRI88862.1 hypothetical protein [Aggregicoccus sp. 17bor-14]
MDLPASLLDFSLVRGGPFARLLPRSAPRRSPERAALLSALGLVLLTWVPLPLVALVDGGPAALRALAGDLPTHAQLLLTLPLMVLVGPYIDRRLAIALRLFCSSELVREKDLPRMAREVEQIHRLRGHPVADGVLLAAAYALSLFPTLALWSSWAVRADAHLTGAGRWYHWVGVPLLRFVLLRWVWRTLMWDVLLLRISRLPLVLVPTHPDRAGGLGFLAIFQASFGALVFAIACTVAAAMRKRQELTALADLLRYASPLLVLAAVSVVVIFAPLVFFFPVLLRTKVRGDEHFSMLAALHSQHFEARWFGREAWAQRRAAGDEVLGAPEISSLTDLGTSFEVERQLRLVPLGRRPVLTVVACALAPVVPLLMSQRQFLTVVLQMAKLFF